MWDMQDRLEWQRKCKCDWYVSIALFISNFYHLYSRDFDTIFYYALPNCFSFSSSNIIIKLIGKKQAIMETKPYI